MKAERKGEGYKRLKSASERRGNQEKKASGSVKDEKKELQRISARSRRRGANCGIGRNLTRELGKQNREN